MKHTEAPLAMSEQLLSNLLLDDDRCSNARIAVIDEYLRPLVEALRTIRDTQYADPAHGGVAARIVARLVLKKMRVN